MGGAEHGTTPSFVLAIDTSLSATAVGLLEASHADLLARDSLPMERGHAEALLPMVDRVVARAPGGFSALRRIAVTVGPGSFTGIRVGIAAARGLALACDIPAVGVSTLAALAAPVMAAGGDATVVAAVDARHGNVYLQAFFPDGSPSRPAAAMPVAAAVDLLGSQPCRLVGSGASMLAIEAWSRGLAVEVEEGGFVPDIAFVARLGALADPARARAAPLYVKPPDATPQAAGRIARSA